MSDIEYSPDTLIPGEPNNVNDIRAIKNETAEFLNGEGWIDTAKIEDGAITTGKIADAAITSAKIAPGAITPGMIGVDPEDVEVNLNGVITIPGIETSVKFVSFTTNPTVGPWGTGNPNQPVNPIDSYTIAAAGEYFDNCLAAWCEVVWYTVSENLNPERIATAAYGAWVGVKGFDDGSIKLYGTGSVDKLNKLIVLHPQVNVYAIGY